MIVIADTSPLNYAVMIGVADALFELYGRIVVPGAVHAELTGSGAPAALRSAGGLTAAQVCSAIHWRAAMLDADVLAETQKRCGLTQ